MSHNTNVNPPRRYASTLRDQQAEATRTRILDALVRTMANGVHALSVPAVAREAGVSVPTIYRHFGSKQGLVEALAPYVATKAGLMPVELPATLEEFGRMARTLFRNLATMDETLRAAMASELGQDLRRAGLPKRMAVVREVAGRLAPEASAPERDRLANAMLILMATPSFHAYRDYLGLGPDASAEFVTWAVGTLVEGVRRHAADGRNGHGQR